MIYGTPEFLANVKNLILGASSKEDSKGKHACYSQCVRHAEEMSWHLYGTKPGELLSRSRPREDPAVTAYRLENYEPTTKSGADKAINIVSKIFNGNLSSIRWKEKNASQEQLREYTEEYYPEHNSITNFCKDVLLRKMLADPNAIAAVRPAEIPESTAEQAMPVVILYGSKNIWYYDYEHYLVFIDLVVENKTKWWKFDYYDKGVYVSFQATLPLGNVDAPPIINELSFFLYPENTDMLPVWRLQGLVESQDNGTIMYKSFFAPAIPFWNYAIIHESDVLAAYIGHMHPIRWEVTEECDYREQIDGQLVSCRGGRVSMGGTERDCPRCGGSGTRPMSPFGVMKIPKSKLDEVLPGGKPFGYEAPPTEATKMLEIRADRKVKEGLWALNMDVEDNVGEVQSGVAKAIDRSAQYDTLSTIASVVFDVHLENIFYMFNAIMNGVKDNSQGKKADANLPEINKPTQFDIAGVPELINNLKNAKDSGLDPLVMNIKEQEILTRDFSTNPDLKLLAQKMLDLDPLPGMTPDEISLSQMKGYVSQVDAVIHFNRKKFIEQAISENKEFLTLPRQEQVDKLEELATAHVAKNKPQLPTPMTPPNATKEKPIPSQTQTP